MVRRSLVIAVFVITALGLAAAPAALAYGPYASYEVDAQARLVQGAGSAVVAWTDGSSIYARRYTGDGPGPVQTLASGIVGLGEWHASGEGTLVTVVWKAGSTVSATCVDVADGSGRYAPAATVTLATDDQAVTLLGAGRDRQPGRGRGRRPRRSLRLVHALPDLDDAGRRRLARQPPHGDRRPRAARAGRSGQRAARSPGWRRPATATRSRCWRRPAARA